MAKFDGLSESEKEDERVFRLRVRDTARLCGNVFSEKEMITRFILGSHADIKTIILSNKSLWGRVSFDDFVRRAQALGDSHRALIGKRTRTCHAMDVWPQGAPAFSQSYQAEDERPEPGQQVLAVGQMPVRDYCSDSPSLATRYDQVFPPGCHKAFMVVRNATQARFGQTPPRRGPR